MSSSDFSSNAKNTPASLYSVAPLTRNCVAKSVLPQPGPPHTNVGLPLGRPPSVISSSPRMPDFTFGIDFIQNSFCAGYKSLKIVRPRELAKNRLGVTVRVSHYLKAPQYSKKISVAP